LTLPTVCEIQRQRAPGQIVRFGQCVSLGSKRFSEFADWNPGCVVHARCVSTVGAALHEAASAA
jgi:hypothetical protein